MVIRSVGVWSVARLYGALSAAGGFILGAFFALFSLIGMGFGAQNDAGWMAGVFGVGAIVLLPIFYGLMGLVGGAIGAFLYNVLASAFGGVEIEVG